MNNTSYKDVVIARLKQEQELNNNKIDENLKQIEFNENKIQDIENANSEIEDENEEIMIKNNFIQELIDKISKE